MLLANPVNRRSREFHVHITIPVPQPHLSPRFLPDPVAEIAVRKEKNLPVLRDFSHNPLRISRGADHVALCFDRRRAVHIRNHVKSRMGREIILQFVGRTGISQRAARLQVGHENLFFGIHDFRCFSHKMNSTKKNHIPPGFLGFIAQPQRVPDIIRHFLNFLRLIIMGQNHGLPILFQLKKFFL